MLGPGGGYRTVLQGVKARDFHGLRIVLQGVEAGDSHGLLVVLLLQARAVQLQHRAALRLLTLYSVQSCRKPARI